MQSYLRWDIVLMPPRRSWQPRGAVLQVLLRLRLRLRQRHRCCDRSENASASNGIRSGNIGIGVLGSRRQSDRPKNTRSDAFTRRCCGGRQQQCRLQGLQRR